jgi:tRNA(adenine34) deaminase
MDTDKDYTYMRAALEEAEHAKALNEVPIGAILVDIESGDIVARAGNRTITNADPTAHAEIVAIRDLCGKAQSQRIPNRYDLYVTLEPCAMCATAISFARIRRIIYGAPDEKGGGVEHGGRFYEQPTCHHKPEIVSGIMANECGQILKNFFKEKRKKAPKS